MQYQDINPDDVRQLQQHLLHGYAGATQHRKSYAHIIELPVNLESGRAMDLLTDVLRYFDHTAATRYGNGRMFLELPSHKYSADEAASFLTRLERENPVTLAHAVNHLREKRAAVLHTLQASMMPAAAAPRTTLHPAAIQPLGTLAPAPHQPGQNKTH